VYINVFANNVMSQLYLRHHFITRFLNSNKLCIAVGSGTQTKIRGAHLLWGVQRWVAQRDSAGI